MTSKSSLAIIVRHIVDVEVVYKRILYKFIWKEYATHKVSHNKPAIVNTSV